LLFAVSEGILIVGLRQTSSVKSENKPEDAEKTESKANKLGD